MRLTPRQRRAKAKRDTHNAEARSIIGKYAVYKPYLAAKESRDIMAEYDSLPRELRDIAKEQYDV